MSQRLSGYEKKLRNRGVEGNEKMWCQVAWTCRGNGNAVFILTTAVPVPVIYITSHHSLSIFALAQVRTSQLSPCTFA